MDVKSGKYKHFKGFDVEVIGCGKHTETGRIRDLSRSSLWRSLGQTESDVHGHRGTQRRDKTEIQISGQLGVNGKNDRGCLNRSR